MNREQLSLPIISCLYLLTNSPQQYEPELSDRTNDRFACERRKSLESGTNQIRGHTFRERSNSAPEAHYTELYVQGIAYFWRIQQYMKDAINKTPNLRPNYDSRCIRLEKMAEFYEQKMLNQKNFGKIPIAIKRIFPFYERVVQGIQQEVANFSREIFSNADIASVKILELLHRNNSVNLTAPPCTPFDLAENHLKATCSPFSIKPAKKLLARKSSDKLQKKVSFKNNENNTIKEILILLRTFLNMMPDVSFENILKKFLDNSFQNIEDNLNKDGVSAKTISQMKNIAKQVLESTSQTENLLSYFIETIAQKFSHINSILQTLKSGGRSILLEKLAFKKNNVSLLRNAVAVRMRRRLRQLSPLPEKKDSTQNTFTKQKHSDNELQVTSNVTNISKKIAKLGKEVSLQTPIDLKRQLDEDDTIVVLQKVEEIKNTPTPVLHESVSVNKMETVKVVADVYSGASSPVDSISEFEFSMEEESTSVDTAGRIVVHKVFSGFLIFFVVMLIQLMIILLLPLLFSLFYFLLLSLFANVITAP